VARTTKTKRVEYVRIIENGRIEERLTIDENERRQFDSKPAAKNTGDATGIGVKWPSFFRGVWDFILGFFT